MKVNEGRGEGKWREGIHSTSLPSPPTCEIVIKACFS